MFPNNAFEWHQEAAALSVDTEDKTSKAYRKWRNRLLDASAFWAHERAGHDWFVTTDKDFNKLRGHPMFPDAEILVRACVRGRAGGAAGS